MYVCDFIQRNYVSIGRNACWNNVAKLYGYGVFLQFRLCDRDEMSII